MKKQLRILESESLDGIDVDQELMNYFHVTDGMQKGINLVLQRYRNLVEAERNNLKTLFAEEQWATILEANHGSYGSATTGNALLCVSEHLKSYGNSYNCDFIDLLNKLTCLNLGQQFALDELVDDFWLGKRVLADFCRV